METPINDTITISSDKNNLIGEYHYLFNSLTYFQFNSTNTTFYKYIIYGKRYHEERALRMYLEKNTICFTIQAVLLNHRMHPFHSIGNYKIIYSRESNEFKVFSIPKKVPKGYKANFRNKLE